MLEERWWKDRLWRTHLHHHERREHDEGDAEQADDLGRVPRVVSTGPGKSQQQRDNPSYERSRAQPVDLRVVVTLTHDVREREVQDGQRGDADRNVHVKTPPPSRA